jgi:hypothetical protein
VRLSDELDAGLRRFLPAGGRFRLCIRDRAGALLLNRETDDPLGVLREFAEDPAIVDLRIEAADEAGVFRTLAPWARLWPDPDGEFVLSGPADPAGLPVRLMIHDEAARTYVVDVAAYGADFRLRREILPATARYRFHHWSPAQREWRVLGPGRLLTSQPTQAPDDPRLDALEALLDRRLPGGWRDSDGLVEFLDDRGVVADAPAADRADQRRAMAQLLSAGPISELRARLLTHPGGGSTTAGPIVPVAGAKPLCDALLAVLEGRRDGLDEAKGLLLYRSADDTARTRSHVAAFLYRALPEGVFRQPDRFDLAVAGELFLEWLTLTDGSPLVGEVLDALRRYDIVRRETIAQGCVRSNFFDPAHLVAVVEPSLAAAASLPGATADAYAERLFRAKLESLRSREAAAELFAGLRERPNVFQAVSDFDNGGMTYFTAARLREREPLLAARRTALIAGLETLSSPASTGETPVFLFSSDPRFLAIYLPHWLSLADYCKARDMEFHVLLNADGEAAREVLSRVEALRQSLASLRGADPERYADNLTFSVCPVPDWCPNPIAFYACSRFLVAGELTLRFGREVLVQDIDFSLVKDPAPFLKNFPGKGIGIHASEGLFGLDPWRRIMGGGFSVPDDDRARASLRHLEHYILEGLAEPVSWFLDQNALTYLVETIRAAPDDHPPLWNLNNDRATAQLRSNRLMERGQGPLDYL